MSDKFDGKSFTIPKFCTSQFVYNFTTLKKFGDSYLTLTTMRVQRTPCSEFSDKDLLDERKMWERWEKSNNYTLEKDPWTGKIDKLWNSEEFEEEERKALERLNRKKSLYDDKKMNESLIRSKRVVFEYAFSNKWDYFATFTIDPNKFDRYNLNEYHKKFSQWLRDYFRKKFNEDVQYLCIPEMHKDGAWHEHALISCISQQHFELFSLEDKLPFYILDKLKKGELIYNCPAYAEKFGFCTFEPVRNNEACAKYITKYITKDMYRSVNKFGAKKYYSSRGIHKAEILKRGYYRGTYISDFSNDYCIKSTFAYSADFLQTLLDKFY